MIKPTIHRNGTSREELAEQNQNARRAVQEAIKALVAAEPNGRDYYPQGPTVIQAALAEHVNRVSKLAEVLKELEELAEHICDA